MWAASGLPLPQLIDRLIQTALRKRPRACAEPASVTGLRRCCWAGPSVCLGAGLAVWLA